jgi:hypothetical protein
VLVCHLTGPLGSTLRVPSPLSYFWSFIVWVPATTHYFLADNTKRDPVKVTLRDTEHRALMEADYEYELDSFGNWTKRTVWVWTRESGERQLLEEDTRTLTYYPAKCLARSLERDLRDVLAGFKL